MARVFVAVALLAVGPFACRASAEPPRRVGTPSGVAAEKATQFACGEATCGGAKFLGVPKYAHEVRKGEGFTAEVVIEHHCGCTRPLSLLIAFNAQGSDLSFEHTEKVEVAPPKTVHPISIPASELAGGGVAPGHYTVTFALYDERERPTGDAITGNPFSVGASREALAAEPTVPTSIGEQADLPLSFVFRNDGDAPARVSALVTFTRIGSKTSIEHYAPGLLVPPGGATHALKVTAEQRHKLGVGTGPWLVGLSAFDARGTRMATYSGHMLAIGKPISQPSAPEVSSPITSAQDLTARVVFKNSSDADLAVTAILTFKRTGTVAPVRIEREGLIVAKGGSTHTIVLSPADRNRYGIGLGHYRLEVAATDAAGTEVEARVRDVVITQAKASDVARR